MIPSVKDQTTQKTTRILIVDDHPLIREGLSARIQTQQDMEVCGEADSCDSAISQIKATNPDLVIVDIQLIDSNGINLVKTIHSSFPEMKVVVVSAFDESVYADRALRAGARGYVNKRELQERILDALRTVINGDRYVSSKMTQQLIGLAIGDEKFINFDPIQNLTNRELEIFELIGRGDSTSVIAGKLQLSTHTIDTYRSKLRQKLGAGNATELMQRAVQFVLERAYGTS